MTVCASRWARSVACLVGCGLLTGILLAGCQRQADPAKSEAAPDASSDQAKGKPPGDPRLHQSFDEATRKEPLRDWQPIDQTLTGKSVGKLYTDAKANWDKVTFLTPEGKAIEYTAVIQTDKGDIEIALKPEWAPNHVRNFVTLARIGYYDGLVFERIYDKEAADQSGNKLEMVEAGCPKGTGTDTGSGSIGYWLKPEFHTQAPHEEGTVGAMHEEEADTAATRFYITLCKAPFLDNNYTVFGKVSKGLDVVRTIFQAPVIEDDQDPSDDRRPEKPVVMRSVKIQTRVLQ